jgi:CBS domain-containing protein
MGQSSFDQSFPKAEKQAVEFQKIQQIWVSDVMTRSPIVVVLSEKIEVAMGLMSDNQIRHLPVVDKDQNIQGILSDRDLIKPLANSKPWVIQNRIDNLRSHNTVRDFMTPTPEIVNPDSTLLEAGSLMLEYKLSSLPVVEGNKVVGIITESDFVKLVCGEHSFFQVS